MKTIKASTLSVILKDSSTVFCGVNAYGDYTNLTLRFDRGMCAVVCGYPETWVLHDDTDPYNPDAIVGSELFEHDLIRDDQTYISAEDELEILKQLRQSVARQFRSKDWSKSCPKRRQQTILNKITRAIVKLGGSK